MFKSKTLLTDHDFIGGIVTETIKDANIAEGKSNEEIQEKIKEAEKKLGVLTASRKNLEQARGDIAEKMQMSSRNFSIEHARLYASINNLWLGFILTDADKNIIMVNKMTKNLFQISPEDSQITLEQLQAHVRGKVDLINSIEYSLKEARQFTFEDVLINNTYANIFISPVIIAKETARRAIGDVILIEDKTEERLNRRSRENFFTIASHELRTPLTGIRGYIALIKQLYFDQIKDEELKRIINDIDASSNRLINIINEFLDTSKYSEDKMKIRLAPCDLIPLIKSIIEETNPIALEKKLVITFNTNETSAMVRGDRDKIRQILINLLSNGIKYTDKGGVTIGIEKTQDSKYKVTFADTGRGISETGAKFLFNKFQQGDAGKNANVISTGLGLYISKLLADKMGGAVTLDSSTEGVGSTFAFAMPVYR